MSISYDTRKWMYVIAVFALTCTAALIILQITTESHASSYPEPIELLPSFELHIEWIHLSVVILYTAGLVSTTTTYIHWYFIPLAAFITIQLIYSTWLLLDKESYIKEQLDVSWQDAYLNGGAENSSILINIQEQCQCQGFLSLSDRPALAETALLENVVVSPCYPVLAQTFGSTVFIWGIGLWVVKLIQAIGLIACYALYIHINYTFISSGRVVIIEEDVENNNIVLPSDDEDSASIGSGDDDDDLTVVDSNNNEKYPIMIEEDQLIMRLHH